MLFCVHERRHKKTTAAGEEAEAMKTFPINKSILEQLLLELQLHSFAKRAYNFHFIMLRFAFSVEGNKTRQTFIFNKSYDMKMPFIVFQRKFN